MGNGLTLGLMLSLALFSMLVYGFLGGRRDADATRKQTHLLLGAGDFLVHWFMWVVGPIERLALRCGLTPEVFNFAGLALGLLSGIAIGMGHVEFGGWAIALGGIADILDGRIARARGLASDYGAFIDSTLDRFVEVFVFLGFCVYLGRFQGGAFAASAAITGSLLVSYTRARGESVGVKYTGGLMQRAERLALTCLVCLADRPLASIFGWEEGRAILVVVSAIALLTFVTATQRTIWIARALLRSN
jgi:phosphatidylglycerophosphate synthase